MECAAIVEIKKGFGNENFTDDDQAKLTAKPGSSRSAESIDALERQYQEDLTLFEAPFRSQIIEMNVDAAGLHGALSSKYCLLSFFSELASLSSIATTELEMFLRRNELISGAKLEDIEANTGSQRWIKLCLLDACHGEMNNPRKMIHMAHSHEDRRIYDSLCDGFIKYLKYSVPKLSLEVRQSPQNTIMIDSDDDLSAVDRAESIAALRQYQEDLALFEAPFRDQIIQMNVDAADLHEAFSSQYCLFRLCEGLASLSSTTTTNVEMFLMMISLSFRATLEDLEAEKYSQLLQERCAGQGAMMNQRELIQMAHAWPSIYDSLCDSFIDYLRRSVKKHSLKAEQSSQNTLMIDSDALSAVKHGSEEEDPRRSQVACPLEPVETAKRAKKIPSETKSIKIGKDGGEIEVGGSFVRFEPGTFNDVQIITVTARSDPGEWPPGREAVTSILDICAKNLQKKATIRLHTWLAADNEYTDVDIMCYKRHIKKWEVFTTSSVGDTGFIEFQSQHFCSLIAVLRNALSETWQPTMSHKYNMRPIISFKSRDFVLALVLEEPLKIEEFLKDMKEDYGPDLKTRKLNPITCTKEKKVECCIEALPDHFQFLDSATCTHNVKSIIEEHKKSYLNCQLEYKTDCSPTTIDEVVPRTIRISLKVDGSVLRTPDCFSYERSQTGNKESTKEKNKERTMNVTGDVNVRGDLNMNDKSRKEDFRGTAINTVNKGTLNSTAQNCTTSISAQKK